MQVLASAEQRHMSQRALEKKLLHAYLVAVGVRAVVYNCYSREVPPKHIQVLQVVAFHLSVYTAARYGQAVCRSVSTAHYSCYAYSCRSAVQCFTVTDKVFTVQSTAVRCVAYNAS